MATGATTKYALPYPLSTDPVRVAGDIQQLAQKVDDILQETIEDTSAAMLTGATVSNGFVLPTYDDSTGKMTFSLSQDLQSTASPSFVGATFTGDVAINGGDLTTTSATATLFNTNATTLNVGQAATTMSVGATTGTITLRNPTVVSAATSLTLFNTTSTTINFGAAATTFNIGGSTGAATVSLANGATTNGTTKTVNIGGSGVSGSITNINIGSSVSGSTGTLTINSPTVSIPSTAISIGTITSGTWSGSTIAVNKGGTGLTSYTIGDIVYASGATTLASLADVATGNVLLSGGVGAAPSYGKVGLTTHVSGTLPVANGGTGVTSSTGSGSVVLSTSPTLTTPNIGSATASYLTVSAQDGVNEGGEIKLNGSGSNSNVIIDNYIGRMRFHDGTNVRMDITDASASVSATTLMMNMNASGSATSNVSFVVDRGSDPNVEVRWNEAGDTWQFTNDGTTFYDIPTSTGTSMGLEGVLFLAGC